MGRSPDNFLSGITFKLIQLPLVKDDKACEDRLVLAGFFYGQPHVISAFLFILFNGPIPFIAFIHKYPFIHS